MNYLFKTDEYKRLISEIRNTRDFTKLVDALDMIPDVVGEQVQEKLARVEAQLDELSGNVRDLKSLVEKMAAFITDLDRKYSELNGRLSRVELTIGGQTEALLSRVIVEELESMGYNIKSKQRNYRINNEDIGLLIIRREGWCRGAFRS